MYNLASISCPPFCTFLDPIVDAKQRHSGVTINPGATVSNRNMGGRGFAGRVRGKYTNRVDIEGFLRPNIVVLPLLTKTLTVYSISALNPGKPVRWHS